MSKDKKTGGLLNLDISIGGVSLEQKAIFAKNLSLMLKAGLSIVEIIEISRDQSSGKLKKVLNGVLSSLESGQSLSSSFARYPKVFSGIFIDVTRAGEESGTLEENFSNISIHLEKDKNLRSKIKGAMFYPVMVLVAAFILGLGMAFFVLPKITPLFSGLRVELPLTTRLLIWFSDLIRERGLILFLVTIAFLVLLIWAMRQKFSHPVTHWLYLKIPLIGKITKQTNLARFCRVLSTLLKSGINFDEALEITRHTMGNFYYKKSLIRVSNSVSKGGKLSSGLSHMSDLYPVITSRMIEVGEKSGSLDDSLLYLATFYEDEVESSTKSLSTVIEPILLIFIGIVVAFLALSIITPIYQITGNVRR